MFPLPGRFPPFLSLHTHSFQRTLSNTGGFQGGRRERKRDNIRWQQKDYHAILDVKILLHNETTGPASWLDWLTSTLSSSRSQFSVSSPAATARMASQFVLTLSFLSCRYFNTRIPRRAVRAALADNSGSVCMDDMAVGITTFICTNNTMVYIMSSKERQSQMIVT